MFKSRWKENTEHKIDCLDSRIDRMNERLYQMQGNLDRLMQHLGVRQVHVNEVRIESVKSDER